MDFLKDIRADQVRRIERERQEQRVNDAIEYWQNNGLTQPPKKDHRGRLIYCGPYSVVAITGADIAEVLAHFNAIRRKKPNAVVEGARVSEVKKVFKRLGYNMKRVDPFGKYSATVATFLKDRAGDALTTPYLIRKAGHYVVVKGEVWADTLNGVQRINPNLMYMRAIVKELYKVLPIRRRAK